MLIVDAQVHIWSGGTPNGVHRQVPAFSAEQLLKEMDAAGVDAALIHPPSWDPNAVEVAVAAARRHPGRLAVLGRFALDDPASRSLVATWKERPGMLGLRFTFLQPHQKEWMIDGTMDWLWPEAERAGLPVALAAADFLPVIGQVAGRHPGLRLIVDHLAAVPGAKDAAAFAKLPELLALARFPHVAVKATAAPGTSSEAYPYRNIHAYLRQIYDAFGPRRMFWGTDITRMPCSWRQCATLFTEELPFLSLADKELVMGRALCDWIGWNLPAA
ncbi:MAG TPA: amidohydrolase family protein [Stellaceae bacterium]|nr:amidohydrolase family protein [Stellaceae bacterium]